MLLPYIVPTGAKVSVISCRGATAASSGSPFDCLSRAAIIYLTGRLSSTARGQTATLVRRDFPLDPAKRGFNLLPHKEAQ